MNLVRELVKENSADLQRQITTHENIIELWKQKIKTTEETLKEHGKSLIEIHNIDHRFENQIKLLLSDKLDKKEDSERCL